MSLILKLDETITDSSLPKLGEMFFDVDAASNFTFTYARQGNVEYTARIIGEEGNFFTDGTYTTSAGTSVTQTTNSLYMSSGKYKVGITQKYSVTDIGCDLLLAATGDIDFDCENLAYCDNNFALHASHWNIKNLSGENLAKCVLINASGATGITADVSEFKSVTSDLYSVNLGSTGVVGDAVDAFGDKIKLNLLSLSSTNTTGSYSDICDAMLSNGRTSGTMTIITADGTGTHVVTFSDNGWTE